MPLGFVVDTSSTNPSIFETELQHNNSTDLTGRLNVTTAVALANTQWPSTLHVNSITPSHQLHTALILDKQNCISLSMYVGCLSFFLFENKRENVWNYVEIQRCPFFFLPFKHWPRYCIFSYSRNQVGYYILSWCNDDYDHLFTRCTRCPPACLCVHERSVDRYDRMEEDVMKMTTMISGVSVLLLLCWMFNFFFLVHERFMRNVCVYLHMCVCLYACFWTLVCFSQGSE